MVDGGLIGGDIREVLLVDDESLAVLCSTSRGLAVLCPTSRGLAVLCPPSPSLCLLLLLHFAFGFSLSLRSAFSLLLPSAAAAIGWFLPQRHVETVEQQLQQVHLEIDSNQERDRNIHQSQHQFTIDSLLYIWKYTLTADGNDSNH